MKLIIHIGGAKCGSSAIQRYNSLYRDRLLSERGILIPDNKLALSGPFTGEQIFLFERMRVDKEIGAKTVERRLLQLKKHMEANQLRTLIVSAENLINPGGFEQLFTAAAGEFEIEIILYVRRQDQYFVSAWQQWHLKSFDSLEGYVKARIGNDANWMKMLEPWELALPQANFHVRRFQRDLLADGDVVADFYHTLGLGSLLDGTNSEVANKSFSEHLGDMASRVRDVFSSPHDNEFYNIMVSFIGSHAFKQTSGSHLFTLEQRQELLAAYDESNERLRAKYFPDHAPDVPLFKPPSEAEIIEISESEKRKAEIDLLTRAIWGMAKRVRALEETARK